MKIEWEDGFDISTRIEDGAIVISANKAGLLSLAKQFTALAEQDGEDHYHLDEHNSLNEGSSELVVEKVGGIIMKKCPKCNGKLLTIVYGMPSVDAYEHGEENGLYYAGCMHDGFKYYCKKCNLKYTADFKESEPEKNDPNGSF